MLIDIFKHLHVHYFKTIKQTTTGIDNQVPGITCLSWDRERTLFRIWIWASSFSWNQLEQWNQHPMIIMKGETMVWLEVNYFPILLEWLTRLLPVLPLSDTLSEISGRVGVKLCSVQYIFLACRDERKITRLVMYHTSHQWTIEWLQFF